MDSDFKFMYPIVTIAQKGFRDDGTTFMKPVDSFKEGHIVYQGRLMCGESMEKLKRKNNTKRQSIKASRIEGVKLCEVCQKKYKENLASAWYRWSVGGAIVGGRKIEIVQSVKEAS